MMEAHRAKQYHLGLGRNTIVKATLAYWKLMKTYVSKGGYSPAGLPSTYKSVFKSAKKEGMSAEEKADRIYSFEYISWGSSQRAFNKVPNYLRKLGVELEMGITTPLGALPVDQLINYNSTTWFFRLKGTNLYYFPGTYPKVASEIPYIYQGRKAYMQDSEANVRVVFVFMGIWQQEFRL